MRLRRNHAVTQVYGNAGGKYAFSTQAGVFFGSILCGGPFVGLHSAKSQIVNHT